MTLALRPMIAADIDLGMRLKAQAGWNQVPADWERLLSLSPGSFVGLCDGTPAGTAVTVRLGRVGWIAMILVDAAFQGRGLGTRLVEATIEHLAAVGVDTMRLDATKLGQPIYQRLGFVGEYELTRWEGVAPVGHASANVRPPTAVERRPLAEFDRRATATDRAALLAALDRQQPGALRVQVLDGELQGYSTWRGGSRAVQLGPAVATSEAAGLDLADAMLAAAAGQRVFVDIPHANRPASAWAQHRGLTPQRTFLRMCRGAPPADHPAHIWASSGPETG